MEDRRKGESGGDGGEGLCNHRGQETKSPLVLCVPCLSFRRAVDRKFLREDERFGEKKTDPVPKIYRNKKLSSSFEEPVENA